MSQQSGFAVWPGADAPVSALTLAREMAAIGQATLSPPDFPQDAARGNGQPVIVLPGFLAPEISTARLRSFLDRQGFQVQSWTGGINIGPLRRVLADMERQIEEIAAMTNRKVALVGVSLGGTTARETAKLCPDRVSRVITLCSPIHLPVATPLAPLAQAAAMLWGADEQAGLAGLAEPPPVPLTALVSMDDGVIDWRAALPPEHDGVEIVKISGPHMTVCSNPDVQRIVAERLAQD